MYMYIQLHIKRRLRYPEGGMRQTQHITCTLYTVLRSYNTT